MTKPNIILILIDDLGWRDLSCFGSSFYETPNLDRMARAGRRFTQAYASCPVCSPTRASLLTGRYPARIGLTDWIDFGGSAHPARGQLVDVPYLPYLPQTEETTALLLGQQGYSTWHVGKWHLGFADTYPERHGFSVNVGGSYLGSPGAHGYFSPYKIPNLASGPPGEYLTDRLTDEAISLIRNRGDQPFYLNLWYYTVHTPIEAKPEKVEKYRAKALAMGLDQQQALVAGEPYPTEHKKHLPVTRRVLQSDPVYAAMVESMDENVGRILQSLQDEDIEKDTLVIFTSDNGGLTTSEGSPTCNAPLAEGKGWMYEGGTRVPFIAWQPDRIEPGPDCHVPVCSIDLLPTFLTYAKTPKGNNPLDGTDLSGLFEGGDSLDREALFWHYPHYGNQGGTPGSSVRCADYKLIEFFENGQLELYNLAEDPSEDQNLAAVEPKLTQELHQRLLEWRQEMSALYPEPNPDWIPDSSTTEQKRRPG